MSLAIKVFILFLLVESSRASYCVNAFANEKQIDIDDDSEIDYFSIFREMILGWLGEAEEKYPLSTSTNYMDRSAFLQEKVRAYVQLWGKWKNHRGYPYGDLPNKLQGYLWPSQYSKFSNYCRESEGKILLTYLIYGLSAEADMV